MFIEETHNFLFITNNVLKNNYLMVVRCKKCLSILPSGQIPNYTTGPHYTYPKFSKASCDFNHKLNNCPTPHRFN